MMNYNNNKNCYNWPAAAATTFVSPSSGVNDNEQHQAGQPARWEASKVTKEEEEVRIGRKRKEACGLVGAKKQQAAEI